MLKSADIANMQKLQTFINLKDIDGKHLMPFVFLAVADIFLKLSQIFLRETRSIYHKSNFSSNKSRETIVFHKELNIHLKGESQ